MYKRVTLIVSMILALLMLQGCANNVKTKTFKGQISGINVTHVFTYEGDRVLTTSTTQIIQYSTLKVSTKSDAQQILQPVTTKFRNLPGIDYKIMFFDTNCEESVYIDYSKARINDINIVMPLTSTGGSIDYVSMSATEANYRKLGLVVVN